MSSVKDMNMSAFLLMMEPLTHTPSWFCLMKFTSLGGGSGRAQVQERRSRPVAIQVFISLADHTTSASGSPGGTVMNKNSGILPHAFCLSPGSDN